MSQVRRFRDSSESFDGSRTNGLGIKCLGEIRSWRSRGINVPFQHLPRYRSPGFFGAPSHATGSMSTTLLM